MIRATTKKPRPWVSPCGNARLYCGDSLKLLARMPDASIDFVFTDPPYGHNNNNDDLMSAREGLPNGRHVTKCRGILNDGGEANDLFSAFTEHAARLLRTSCCCCCCCCCCGGGGGPDPQFARWSLRLDEVMQFKQMVVWDKGWGLGWHYRRCYETVLVAQKGKGRCAWYDETKAVKNIIRHGEIKRQICRSEEDHPTPKPPELPARFIGLHSKPGDVVLDPFMGAGSTGIAAVRMGRKFIGIELDPEHFESAKRKIKAELKQLAEAA